MTARTMKKSWSWWEFHCHGGCILGYFRYHDFILDLVFIYFLRLNLEVFNIYYLVRFFCGFFSWTPSCCLTVIWIKQLFGIEVCCDWLKLRRCLHFSLACLDLIYWFMWPLWLTLLTFFMWLLQNRIKTALDPTYKWKILLKTRTSVRYCLNLTWNILWILLGT